MADVTDPENRHLRSGREYWRRVDDPVLGWWPWALLCLVALALLFLWGVLRTAPHIQAEVRNAVEKNLQQSKITLIGIDADGQAVSLTAEEQPDAEPYIRSIAVATECDTWIGSLICPTTVDLALVTPAAQEAGSSPVAALPRHHDFVAIKTDTAVTLRGEAPDQATRRRIVELAASQFDAVDDQLRVTGAPASGHYANATRRALDVLQRLDQGEAHWVGGSLNVSGVVRKENEDAAREAFHGIDNAPTLGLLALETVATTLETSACNAELRTLLENSTINFESGSAAIAGGSEGVLQRLAQLAGQCPGRLLVEGHTDNVGSDGLNLTLSRQRAQAVRENLITLGVPEQNLLAEGYGSSQPIADNTTPAGRAANRRIVVKVVE